MAATTPTLIPVEEYLRTTYRPDCDYVDGEVLERNMGETPHGCLQNFFGFLFRLHRDDWQVEVFPETRLQVKPDRYRVPDVMLVAPDKVEPRIIRTPPILCVEVLSSEDRMCRTKERVGDYARVGAAAIWVIDPWRRVAYSAGADATLHEQTDCLTVPGTRIAVSVPDIWVELDRLESLARRFRGQD